MSRTLLDLYAQQITRDKAVLLEDPMFHEPSREFYRRRILLYGITLAAQTRITPQPIFRRK